jgi:threonine synthase
MPKFAALRCSRCGAAQPPSNAPRYGCAQCSAETLEVVLDLADVSASVSVASLAEASDRSLWRYGPLLPVATPPRDCGPLRQLGGTPLYAAPRSQAHTGLRSVWIKDDGRLPTGSLKDRASAVVAMRARELGESRIITASTGNAGVAIAAMARAAGIMPVVLVPETAPAAKIAQLLVFGAELYLVRGNYDAAFALSRTASQQLGIYCRNTAYNPFTIEGKKTVSFEICEQLTAELGSPGNGRWRAPDRVYVSVGDGNIISGVHKGFRELQQLGWIERVPKLIGVQAAGSAAIAKAFDAGADEVAPVKAATLADSIAADQPADGLRALHAARDTGGSYVTVSDDAILEAIVKLARDTTVFAEPAAAAAYAGLLDDVATGRVDREEQVVVLVTGNGLKDVNAATRATGAAPIIDADVEALARAMNEHERKN